MALIKKGKVDDYIVGFDELGGTDDFDTQLLEERLARYFKTILNTSRIAYLI